MSQPPPGQYPGGPGQPPYNEPGQPGQYGQPPQYGQPGGPGQAPRRRGPVIALVAGLVAAIVAAVVLFFVLRDDDPAPAATSSTTSASSSSTSRSSSTAPSTSASPSTGAPGSGGDLLAIVPADFTDCAEAELAGDGDVAHASCGASTTQPGPQQAEFFQYPDQATMDSVFTNDVSAQGLSEVPDGQDCTTTTGVGAWGGGSNTGLVACAIDTGNGAVVITWTDDAALVEGIVAAPGTTQGDLAALYAWWTANSDYQL